MSFQDIITALFTYVIAPLAGGFVGWLFGPRRKTKAEATTTELENVESAIAIYRSITDDLKKQIEELMKEIEKLRIQNGQLLHENSQMKAKLESLERKIDLNTPSVL